MLCKDRQNHLVSTGFVPVRISVAFQLDVWLSTRRKLFGDGPCCLRMKTIVVVAVVAEYSSLNLRETLQKLDFKVQNKKCNEKFFVILCSYCNRT